MYKILVDKFIKIEAVNVVGLLKFIIYYGKQSIQQPKKNFLRLLLFCKVPGVILMPHHYMFDKTWEMRAVNLRFPGAHLITSQLFPLIYFAPSSHPGKPSFAMELNLFLPCPPAKEKPFLDVFKFCCLFLQNKDQEVKF